MFSGIFSPVKPSTKKPETMEELLSEDDWQRLADIIDYCVNGMTEHARKNTGSGQQPTNPDPDDPANRVMETPWMNQNLGSSSHSTYDNPAVNPGYQLMAPSPGPAPAQTPAQNAHVPTLFQLPTPYNLSLPSASPAKPGQVRAETILDESNLLPSAIDE